MSNTYTVEKKSETKTNPQHSPTIRIQAELFEPTESRYPVFNYQKLLIEEKKRRRKDLQSNSVEENEESIKQLADHYEQKYGINNGVKKKKKKKTAFYNYSELAAGYDENDSFIDNTEIFDEVMPEEFETKHGGYYVNSGSLELKKVHVSEDSEENISSQPRKSFIKSSLEEDSDEKLPNFTVSNNSEKNSLIETMASETSHDSSSCSDEEKETSKPKCASTLSVNGKIKRRKSLDSDSANYIIPTKKKKTNSVKSIQEKMFQTSECKPSCSKENRLKSEETPLIENNVSSINDTIESVIYGSSSILPVVSSIQENEIVKNTQNVLNSPISIDVPESNGVNNTTEELPKIILEIIELIKTEAQLAIQNNLSIFSEQINLYLLSLEYQKELIKFKAQPIYAILAEHLLCDEEKLVKQVNQLVDLEEAKINEPIERLKNAIKKVLPTVIEQHNLECNRILDQRNVNGTSNDGFKSKPGPKRPRRKFPWNEEFRGYVREIINIRTTTYSKIKRSHSIDVYISQFINNRIKPLWPNGWMKTTIILKELKAKEKDSRPKLPKKQPLQNSPTKLLSAIKLASKHKVSNSAMNKFLKWNKQKPLKTSVRDTGTTAISTGDTPTSAPSTTSNLKQLCNSSQSVTVNTVGNDIYQATITTTAINGCKQKESETNSVIVKTKIPAGDILDLSPNKSSQLSFGFNKLKDVTVICNNTSQDNNSSTKTDLQISPKHTIHYPISRKQRLLQELHNTLLPDQQILSTHVSTVDQQSITLKDDISILSSNKSECIKVDDKSTAKDVLSQIINESLMDNTSPLPSQFNTNNFFKSKEDPKLSASIITKPDVKSEYMDWEHSDRSTTSRPPLSHQTSSAEHAEKERNNFYTPKEDTKLPASVITKPDVKSEYMDWQHSDRSTTSRPPLSHRASSAELAEKETQKVIRDLLVLNKLSSCSSRDKRDNTYNKHSPSVSMFSSHTPDKLVSSPLGVIHHPVYRNSYSTTGSTICKSRNESTHGTTVGIPKMNIGFQDEFLKHMVKTEEPSSRLTTDSYQKHGIPHYGLLQSNTQSSDNLFQHLYSTLNTKPNQDMSHNSITYSDTNE